MLNICLIKRKNFDEQEKEFFDSNERSLNVMHLDEKGSYSLLDMNKIIVPKNEN